MENELMANEEVMETAMEEVTESGSGGGSKIAVGVGVGILAGMAICKLAKPVMAKIRARRKSEDVVDTDVVADAEFVEETEESKGNPGK